VAQSQGQRTSKARMRRPRVGAYMASAEQCLDHERTTWKLYLCSTQSMRDRNNLRRARKIATALKEENLRLGRIHGDSDRPMINTPRQAWTKDDLRVT
jgi:hypothetical protein